MKKSHGLLPLVAFACAASASNADWPTYRGDAGRTATTLEAGPELLRLAWRLASAAPPRPAWPPPADRSYWQRLDSINPRITDDHAFHPVASGGTVYFASSADDTLRAMDAATGAVRWRFTADGPLRYAPAVAEGRVFVGGDDGCVACLDAVSGELLWRRRIADEDRRIPGNGRLISDMPVRTGLVVRDGAVYVAAGLFPSQGVFAAALDAATGDFLWRRPLDASPQGYLLLSEDRLFVPTGRGSPIVLDRASGAQIGSLQGKGGTFAVVAHDEVVFGVGNQGGLDVADARSTESLVAFEGTSCAASRKHTYLLGEGRLIAIDRVNHSRLVRERNTLRTEIQTLQRARRAATEGEETRELLSKRLREAASRLTEMEEELAACRLWETSAVGARTLAATPEAVVTAGDGFVQLLDAETGIEVDRAEVDGVVLGVAIDDGRLFAATDLGTLYCFGPEGASAALQAVASASSPSAESPLNASSPEFRAAAALQESIGSTRGYGLLVGADLRTLAALLAATELHWIVVDADREKIETLRNLLLDAGDYGDRAAVHHIAGERLPFADYFANLVFVADDARPWSRAELERMVRPAGGVAWIDSEAWTRPPLPGVGRWVHQYGDLQNTTASGDATISGDLALQWFGSLGPQPMVDRHLRAPAPLVADGRTFVPGENQINCIDSYHGTEYWRLDIPGSQRYSAPFDGGYICYDAGELAIAVQEEAWFVDARNGRIARRIPLLKEADDSRHSDAWGYLAILDDRVVGTRQAAKAARLAPSRELISDDYQNAQPLATSHSLFSLDRATGDLAWEFRGTIINSTIAIGDGAIFFIATLAKQSPPRAPLDELLGDGAEVVCLDAASGELQWRRPAPKAMLDCVNILYLQLAGGRVMLSGSLPAQGDTLYRLAALDAATGDLIWEAEHLRGKPGEFGHGEQVHHPVVLGDWIVAEPRIYSVASGATVDPFGDGGLIRRPGHGCGNMSGGGTCLFFRSGVTSLLDFSAAGDPKERFVPLAPSRPGCWINIIPADGLVIVPEASSGCVCNYSIQASMAFAPRSRN